MPLEGAIRFLEGAGTRGALELLGEEVLALLRAGTRAERIGIVCPSIERWRASLETALATLGVPFAIDGRTRLGQTDLGRPLLALLRFAWLGGSRGDLFAFLRSPYSALPRANADFLEGRLRGRGIATPERVVEEAERLRGAPLPAVETIREAEDPVAAVREQLATMLRAASRQGMPSNAPEFISFPPSDTLGNGSLSPSPSLATTCRIGSLNCVANSKSRLSCAGTAMMAPVPYSMST